MQNYHIFERYRNIFSIAIGDDVMAFGIIRGPVADKIPRRSRHKTSRNAAKNINIFFRYRKYNL